MERYTYKVKLKGKYIKLFFYGKMLEEIFKEYNIPYEVIK